jgi:hypothetical protein
MTAAETLTGTSLKGAAGAASAPLSMDRVRLKTEI